MKRFLSAFFAACLFSAAIVGGLSVLPHSHGKDFDHSSHQTCPVHQAGSHSLDAAAPVFNLSVFFLVTFFVAAFTDVLCGRFSRTALSPRAPPLGLSVSI